VLSLLDCINSPNLLNINSVLIEFCFQVLLFQCCVQGFITDNDKTLEELFSESAEGSHKYNACLNTMATRIAMVFASMRVGFTILYLQSLYTWMDVCFFLV
jgi:hypothetical protein